MTWWPPPRPTQVVADQHAWIRATAPCSRLPEVPADDPRRIETYPDVSLVDAPRRTDTVLGSSDLVGLAEDTTTRSGGHAGAIALNSESPVTAGFPVALP
jgi:hypothetical protein